MISTCINVCIIFFEHFDVCYTHCLYFDINNPSCRVQNADQFRGSFKVSQTQLISKPINISADRTANVWEFIFHVGQKFLIGGNKLCKFTLSAELGCSFEHTYVVYQHVMRCINYSVTYRTCLQFMGIWEAGVFTFLVLYTYKKL